jgi:uncharacterized protein
VILNLPFISGKLDAANFPDGLLDEIWEEREASTGSGDPEPTYMDLWPTSLANSKGEEGDQTFITSETAWDFLQGALKLSEAAGTPWENKVTKETFYYLAKAEPGEFIHRIAPRPLLHLAAAIDPLSGPLEEQRRVFEKAGENAEFVVLEPDHIATYFGEPFERTIEAQLEFLQRTLVPSTRTPSRTLS